MGSGVQEQRANKRVKQDSAYEWLNKHQGVERLQPQEPRKCGTRYLAYK